MPLLRCIDEDCGHEWFERSQLAEGAPCEICGEPTVVVGVDDEPPAELDGPVARPVDERAHPGHARTKAREVLREHHIAQPHVPVHAIARKCGFEVRPSQTLGKLRARLVGKTIEVNANEPPAAQRFSVAHELGHFFLGTRHGAGDIAEREADAFAGELLVPGYMLESALVKATEVAKLMGIFKVSRQVLEIAAKDHKLDGRLT